jgi:hypothetical protein
MTLTTKSGKKIPELAIQPSLFLDKTAVLYGPTKTGKTVITKTIMGVTSGHIEQVLVVAPTEPSNRSYEGFVDKSLVHYRMYLADPEDKRDTEQKAALRFLERIYKRQEMMASIYTRANDLNILAHLYGRLSHKERKAGNEYIASLARKRKRVIGGVKRQFAQDGGKCQEKIKEVTEKFEKMLGLLYKKFLTPHVDRLWTVKDLSEAEKWTLQYLHFNPRLLLIFDDCAAQLKPFFRREIFRKLFYQNRHSYISVVICCQDDTDLPPELRKNAFISIFTEEIVCSSNFQRGANRFPKSTKDYVSDIMGDVFVGHRKLAYIRDDPKRQHFYHLTCPYPKRKMFGSDALLELCDNVRAKGITMDKSNPFFDKFRID